MTHPLLFDGTWAQQWKYESAEAFYQEVVSGNKATTPTQTRDSNKAQGSNLKSELAQARQNITKALNEGSSQTGSGAAADQQVLARLKALETENNNLKKASQDLTALVKKLETRVVALEKSGGSTPAASSAPKTETKPAAKDDDEDSDFDPFGDDSDSDDEETKKRLAEYAAKKDKKPVLIAKSSLLIDVKPWDDETDMAELERLVRTVTIDGLLWGASKLVPVGYGIKKLQINAVIEDDKVSTDALEEAITGFEDHVQSMDIAAFNKI